MRTIETLLLGLSCALVSGCGDPDSGAGGNASTSPSTGADGTNASASNGASSGGSGGSGGAPITGTSISQYAACDGTTDDAKAVATAIEAAKNHAFNLIVDCPIFMHVGIDIERPVFIEDGTTIAFTGAGKITVDNTLQPAFVIADSSDVFLKDWDLVYDASLPVDMAIGGYEKDGEHIDSQGSDPVGGSFNDLRITPWLRDHRNITFDHQTSRWMGPTNTSSIFFVTGDVGSLKVTGMNAHVPDAAGAERYIPMVFSFGYNYLPGKSVDSDTPLTTEFFGMPHDLTFSGITFDGTLMGFQGSVRDAVFENVESARYADLQDENGENVGGKGKWFAPPHLFYLNYSHDEGADPLLFNENIEIRNVSDNGPRVGGPRDKGGSDTISGYALSLKIGGNHVTIDGYTSTRPDGFIDVLTSDGLTLSNVTASYDSKFLNDLFPGWRFPQSPYANVTFEHVTFSDTATGITRKPVGDANSPENVGIVMNDVNVTVNDWNGTDLAPALGGGSNTALVTYQIQSTHSTLVKSQKSSVSFTFQATPSTPAPGAQVALAWKASGASGCTPTGDWSGTIGTNGTKSISFPSAGNHSVTLTCQSGADTTTATIPIVVGP